MDRSPRIAVAHYPEGAGHATRMLAVANALRQAGTSVELAGGGAGTEFVDLHGYDAFEPTPVHFIDAYQGGSLRQVLGEAVPAAAARVADYVDWLRDVDPDALVTDDMFAAIASTRTDVPLYVLKHDVPALYEDWLERAGASLHTAFQAASARTFFYPAVWPPSAADPAAATRVPPVALTGEGAGPPGTEVVVVPSEFSDLGRLADHLRRQGHAVLDVGGDTWDPMPSLLPVLRAADVVVCSGYSTVMEAAVAGTPCVVHPATTEQRAVANWLDRFDVTGFAVARRPLDVLDAVADPPDAPKFRNGARDVATAVLEEIEDELGTAGGRSAPSTADRPVGNGEAAATPGARVAAADRLVTGAAAVGTARTALDLLVRGVPGGTARDEPWGSVSARPDATFASRLTATDAGSVTDQLVRAGRDAARRWRRRWDATAAMATAAGIVGREALGGPAVGVEGPFRTAVDGLRETARRTGRRAVDRLPGPATASGRRLAEDRAVDDAGGTVE